MCTISSLQTTPTVGYKFETEGIKICTSIFYDCTKDHRYYPIICCYELNKLKIQLLNTCLIRKKVVRQTYGFQFQYMVENTTPVSSGTDYPATFLDSYLNIGNNSSIMSPNEMISRSSLDNDHSVHWFGLKPFLVYGIRGMP